MTTLDTLFANLYQTTPAQRWLAGQTEALEAIARARAAEAAEDDFEMGDSIFGAQLDEDGNEPMTAAEYAAYQMKYRAWTAADPLKGNQ